jgi:hypothetical protein
VLIAVRVGNRSNGVEQPELPQHRQHGAERYTWLTVLDAVQRAAANAAGLGQVVHAQPSAQPGDADALAQQLSGLQNFQGKRLGTFLSHI